MYSATRLKLVRSSKAPRCSFTLNDFFGKLRAKRPRKRTVAGYRSPSTVKVAGTSTFLLGRASIRAWSAGSISSS